jgi:uncharacterized LabA/DUF88 family protein
MPAFLPAATPKTARVMMFVDGENLAKRYKNLLGDTAPKSHVVFEPDIYVWSRFASRQNGPQDYIRRYYYTSAHGDAPKLLGFEQSLRNVGIEAPRVFPRKRNGRSKRVDISLATDMLTHAHRKNYDIAVLVAGDEDYVPLVEAVKAEGRRVALWFVQDGLSVALRAAADHFWDIGECLLDGPDTNPAFAWFY